MSLLYPREMLDDVIKEHRRHVPPSELDTLRALVDTVFFASLMLEEGEPVRVAIVHREGGASALAHVVDSTREAWGEEGAPSAWTVTKIERCRFEPRTIAKLSRGLKYGTHLVVVGGTAPELWIEGIARRASHTDGGPVTRIAAPRPGVIVFENHEGEFLRFDAGQRVPPTVDVLGSGGPVRNAVGAITGQGGPASGYSRREWAIMKLLRRMRATGKGAILAMLPEVPGKKVLEEVRYRREDAQVLADRIQSDWDKWKAWMGTKIARANESLSAEQVKSITAKRTEYDAAREALDAAIDDVARLSAIDGAVLAGPQLAIYGAGYIIRVLKRVKLKRFKAFDAGMKKTEPLSQAHGARHEAAYSFAQNHPGGVAFVVSEDGPVHCALRVRNKVVVWPVRVSET